MLDLTSASEPQKRILFTQAQRKTGTVGAQPVRSALMMSTHKASHVYSKRTHMEKKMCEGNSRCDDMLNYPGDVWLNEPLVLITLRINQQP